MLKHAMRAGGPDQQKAWAWDAVVIRSTNAIAIVFIEAFREAVL